MLPVEPTSFLHPVAPATVEETGVSVDLITDLALKAIHGAREISGADLAKRLGVGYAVVEPSLQQLKAQRFAEIAAGAVLGGPSFRYRLTDTGRDRAFASLERSQYVGVVPIPIEQYRRYMLDFKRALRPSVTPDQIREALSDLVLAPRLFDELGPAVNAGHSIFIYGPPGNGKSVIARSIRKVLAGTIAVPQALEVDGNVIRFYDPSVHQEVPLNDQGGASIVRYDRRWVQCQRPTVSVGGELTLQSLELTYSARSGSYRAPVQALANGGVLVIDDFGRQQCSPRDLLNWWMVPLESGVEFLMLQSGQKIEMPFLSLVVFSTNINPADLVDEAFLRRIRYKIYAGDPTREDFILIFERCCEEQRVPFDRQLVEDLLERYYRARGITPRACHPRDLIAQALALTSYRGLPRRLTSELLDSACAGYFLGGEGESPSPTP